MDDYDLLPCGVLIVELPEKVHYCNAPFAAALGLSVDEVTRLSISNLLSKASTIIFQQIVLPSLLKTNKIDEVQLNFLNAQQQKLPMIIFAKRDMSNNDRMVFCCFSAIEREKMLSQLSQSKKELEQVNAKLKTLSKTDQLTGCLNRREFDLQLTMIRRQAKRQQSSSAIIMMDLDNFKQLNDSYGHVEGDYVLKQFAALLMDNARFDDVVARYGGEEFVMILSNADKNIAQAVVDRIHQNMKKIRSKAKVVTVSIGVCMLSGTYSGSDEDVINEADKALYQSKNTGKNKSTFVTLK